MFEPPTLPGDYKRQRLYELAARLRAGDPEAAFRLKQRQRGKKSAAVMRARLAQSHPCLASPPR